MATRVSNGTGLALPGVNSDGQSPGGIVVDGGIGVGDPTHTNFVRNTFNGVTQFIYGQVDYEDGPYAVDIDQIATTTLADGDVGSALQIRRMVDNTATGTITTPIVQISDRRVGGPAIQPEQALINIYADGHGNGFSINAAGFIGMGGKVPPTVGRTLAQATITAITDTNAKTAIQAIANALVDIGALTLT